MSSVLGSSVSFVTSLSFSTTGGGIGGPSYETPLRVVIALASFLGFGMVLLGKELELEGGDKLVSWSSKKQDCTLMSSAEAEYHFIKEQVGKRIVELFFVGTEYQLADLFTKALSEDRFKYLVRRLSLRCLTPDELEVLAIESA
ncbi:hypothetical protein Tco_0681265 [Tanacetum coccineum]|uniref:Retrovirus-related Pol polyprotein from transposon TNT 1-94 n=1 Tax=Tanacetum coccineum TaxID=301880 RepID=A0ABQ4XNM6_9ASTR